MEINIEDRVRRALDNFEGGYNCSQSVFLAYSDLFGIDRETAAKFSSSFGAGMGRLREVCGAATGMFMVLGFLYPATDVNDRESKTRNYEAVQRLAAEFKEEMGGSYICADLLKIRREPQDPAAVSERNSMYYALRPCSRCVAMAAHIVGEEIKKALPDTHAE